MDFADVKVRMPKAMEYFLAANKIEDDLIRNAMILYPYINNLTISHGRAAEILGITKEKLINLYGDMGIPYLNYDISEVEEEVEIYKKLYRNIETKSQTYKSKIVWWFTGVNLGE